MVVEWFHSGLLRDIKSRSFQLKFIWLYIFFAYYLSLLVLFSCKYANGKGLVDLFACLFVYTDATGACWQNTWIEIFKKLSGRIWHRKQYFRGVPDRHRHLDNRFFFLFFFFFFGGGGGGWWWWWWWGGVGVVVAVGGLGGGVGRKWGGCGGGGVPIVTLRKIDDRIFMKFAG